MEGIMRQNSDQLESMVTNKTRDNVNRSTAEYGRSSEQKQMNNNQNKEDEEEPITVDGVYNELIHLRKMNRVLGARIKHLEVQNFNMTSQGFNTGYKAEEPNRPIFSGGGSNQKHPDSGFNSQFETPADNNTQEDADYDQESDS